MIVCDVTSFFSAACGGIKTYYREKARWLPRRGVECHFVVPGPRDTASRLGGGTLHTVSGPRWCRHYRLFGSMDRLMDRLAAIAPDVIELGSHYLLPDVIARSLWRIRSRPRLLGFYHADFPSTYVAPALARLPRVQRVALAGAWQLVRHHHRRYAMTLVGSRHIADRLAQAQVPRVRWVGLGVDTERFAPRAQPHAPVPGAVSGLAGAVSGLAGAVSGLAGAAPGLAGAAPTVAYVGRLARDKELPLLLAAFDTIHAAAGARLVVAGDGPLLRKLRAYARARPHVVVLGYIDQPAYVADILAAADVVVATGSRESFSITAAEALACGTPVVGADQGGNAELIERSGGGLTFTAGSASSLAARVIELCAAPRSVRARMGELGRAYVTATHTWEQVLCRIHAAYEEALAC